MDTKDIRALKEDIRFSATVAGETLSFRTTWGIFSPREIDEGSKLLLENIEVPAAARICDIGCGYGALGLFLARRAPQGRVTMVDTDFTAVQYAKKNAAGNGITNCDIYLSNAFSEIPHGEKFDVIVSNLPAKVGREMLWIILNDAKAHLAPDGVLYVVTISGLREFIKKNFKEVFGNYDKIKQGRAYTVAAARKSLHDASAKAEDSEV